MKKLLLVIALFTTLFLAACTQTASNETQETETKTETKKNEETKEAPVEKNEPESEESALDYANEMSEHLTIFSELMYQFSDLNTRASQDPSIMETDEWITEAATVLVGMQEVIDAITSVNPPSDVDEIHIFILQAMEEYQFVVDNYPDAVDNQDVELMLECADAIIRGTEHMNQANMLMAELFLV